MSDDYKIIKRAASMYESLSVTIKRSENNLEKIMKEWIENDLNKIIMLLGADKNLRKHMPKNIARYAKAHEQLVDAAALFDDLRTGTDNSNDI